MSIKYSRADGPPPEGEGTRLKVLLTSYLTGLLKYAGPVCAPRAAAAFLERAGKEREVFLPFFYHWFDGRQWAQDQALRLMRVSVTRDRFTPPHVFHGPFPGRRHGYLSRSYYRDLADKQKVRENQLALQRECVFLGSVQREFGLREQILYILHLGRRWRLSATEALRVSLEALRPAVDVAREHGVILALENVADRSGTREYVGARLPEIEDAIGTLNVGYTNGGPVGWTFDISHALLGYRGDSEAVVADLKRLLSSLVHIHINAPRFYPSEQPWADRHEAPTEGFRPLWELFRLALTSQRFRQFCGVTYEVNWAAPLLNPLVGGSNLPAVARGYELVRRVAMETLGTLDEAVVAASPVPGTANIPGTSLTPGQDAKTILA